MGLLDLFKLNNSNIYKLTNNDAQLMLKKCRTLVDIINKSTNANQFFSSFNKFIEILKELSAAEKYISFKGEKPHITLQRVLSEKEKHINDFIKRSANNIKSELSRFTSIESQEKYINMQKENILKYKSDLSENNLFLLNNLYSLNYLEGLIGGYSNETWHKSYKNNIKYHSVISAHQKYTEKINILYSIASNLETPNSPEMNQVIELCIADIKLAKKYKQYCLEDNKIFNRSNDLPIYQSFKRLVIIYEKQKEYSKAIEICRQAIDLGFYKDGTSGQMPGRLARLIKKEQQSIAKTTN